MTTRAISFLISGRVQGVGMRWSMLLRAEDLGLVGWARNLPSGEVEGLAQGETTAVDQFIDWLDEGPAYARVHHVVVQDRPVDPQLHRFEIR